MSNPILLVSSLMDLANKSPGTLLLWETFLEAINEPEFPKTRVELPVKARADCVVLVSGGLDSSIAYWRLKSLMASEPLGLYIDFGQPYRNAELRALATLGIPYRYEDYSSKSHGLNKDWQHIIPGRNLLALLVAPSYVETGIGAQVWFAVTEGESPATGGDKSSRFLGLVQNLYDQFYDDVALRGSFIRNQHARCRIDRLRWAGEAFN